MYFLQVLLFTYVNCPLQFHINYSSSFCLLGAWGAPLPKLTCWTLIIIIVKHMISKTHGCEMRLLRSQKWENKQDVSIFKVYRYRKAPACTLKSSGMSGTDYESISLSTSACIHHEEWSPVLLQVRGTTLALQTKNLQSRIFQQPVIQ